MSVRATVYITGSEANERRAAELTKAAAKEFKSGEVNGVSVSFNVTFQYVKDIQKSDLQANKGQNLLTFDKTPESKEKRSFVTTDRKDESGNTVGGRYFGTIYSSGEDNEAVLHETGHLLGLEDQYLDIVMAFQHLDPNALTDYAKGYENDLMGGGSKFNPGYRQAFLNVGATVSDMFLIAPSFNGKTFESHIPYSGPVNENHTERTQYNWPPDSPEQY